MVAVISNDFSVHEEGEKNWSKHCLFLATWNWTEVDSVTQNVRCTCKHYHCVAEHVLKKSSRLCFDLCVKRTERLCCSIIDNVTLRFF